MKELFQSETDEQLKRELEGENVKMEIERKFLLKWIPQGNPTTQYIEQFYGKDEQGNFRIRRIAEEPKEGNVWDLKLSWILTRKTPQETPEGFINIEDECEITQAEFNNYRKLSNKYIVKKRLIYQDPNNEKLKWEVDCFNFSLIVAEIELPSIDYKINIPDFINKELIGEVHDKCFSNYNLANDIITKR